MKPTRLLVVVALALLNIACLGAALLALRFLLSSGPVGMASAVLVLAVIALGTLRVVRLADEADPAS